MTRKLVSKKELKSVYGVPYCPAHIARLEAAGTMLLTDMTEINSDVIDAVGELTNMVAGGAKAQLEHLNLSISLPNVITGLGHEVRFPSNVTPIVIPFDSDWGPLTAEVGLSAAPAAPTHDVFSPHPVASVREPELASARSPHRTEPHGHRRHARRAATLVPAPQDTHLHDHSNV